MGDTTGLNVHVRGAMDARVRTAIRDTVSAYGHTYRGEDHEDAATGTLELYAGDVSCGSVPEIVKALADLVKDGIVDDDDKPVTVPDFAWRVFDEPKYEFNGDLRVHVPVLGDYASECDSNGDPIVNPDALVQVVERSEDIETARAAVRGLTGKAVRDAFAALPDGGDPQTAAA